MSAETTRNLTQEYYRNHACCPECGTPVGHNSDSPVEIEETGYDGNRARCPNQSCTGTPGEVILGTQGKERTPAKPWEGIIHELVAKGKSRAEQPKEVTKK